MSRFVSEILVPQPPVEVMSACVILPARNEEELLPVALHALAEQRRLDGTALPYESYEVILLINNTADASGKAARRVAAMYPLFRLHIVERWFKKPRAHIGVVRRVLMDEACRRLELAGSTDPLILSTDSDTRVAPNWIARNQHEARLGAEAIGGRIAVAAAEQNPPHSVTQRFQHYDHLYRRLISWLESRLDPEEHDPWPRHQHHFGASLAIKPDVYQRVGRLPPRRYLEDVALYTELMRRDVKLRHSNAVRVYTSARLSGRAAAGFSRTLAEWQRDGNEPCRTRVESKPFLEFLFGTRRELRRAWQQRELDKPDSGHLESLTTAIGTNAPRLRQEISLAPHFGSLLEKVRFYEACRSAWPHWRRLAPLRDVVDELYAEFRLTTKPPQKAIQYQSSSRWE